MTGGTDVRALIEEVRRTTARLAETDPSDMAAAERALELRAEAIRRFAAAAPPGTSLDEESVAVLRACTQQAAGVELRLRLLKASLQQQLRGVDRQSQWLGAIEDTLPGGESHFTDVQG